MTPILKKISASLLLAALCTHDALAFCGFYVSKADGTLQNKTSQVIMVRDGDRNVITMYNDFKGAPKEFAMVVPMPVVLQKKDIRVVDGAIFRTLNEYSQARLVEYYDENPCHRVLYDMKTEDMAVMAPSVQETKAARRNGVRIEAQYLVGEYDILILSAKESAGLQRWLDANGYKIPPAAKEVLQPYINSNLKFFVAKVNEAELKKLNGSFLRPLQISFTSPKFMLPIRLGMANAAGDQDLIVYAFSRKGRVECTNYRTVPMPTGQKVPLFVQKDFGKFYSKTFERTWFREGRSVGLLEYAWDVSPRNYVKCDPCVSTAPAVQDLVQAGVWWLSHDWNDYSDVATLPDDNVHFTRLHFRYNRETFPQDLVFQVTPNTEPFQARYVITHPAEGPFDCAESKAYLRTLQQRRGEELRNLNTLTGTVYRDWTAASVAEPGLPEAVAYGALSEQVPDGARERNLVLFAALGLAASLSAWGVRRRV